MKSIILFAAVLVLANADSNILRRIKPILMMGETILKMQDKNQCYQKSFCVLETMANNRVMNPLAHLSRYLTNSHLDFESKDFEKISEMLQSYPKFTEIINSILFGRQFNSTAACSQQFPSCTASVDEIINSVKSFDDEHVMKTLLNMSTKRNGGCDAVDAGCGAAGIGCGLCAALTEGLCGFLCAPETGAACGGVGLGCLFG